MNMNFWLFHLWSCFQNAMGTCKEKIWTLKQKPSLRLQKGQDSWGSEFKVECGFNPHYPTLSIKSYLNNSQVKVSNIYMQIRDPEKDTRKMPANSDNVIFHIIQLLQGFHSGANHSSKHTLEIFKIKIPSLVWLWKWNNTLQANSKATCERCRKCEDGKE